MKSRALLFLVMLCIVCFSAAAMSLSQATTSSSSSSSTTETSKPPNIIVIMADDLGWNDVSFHGSNQIPTPNIDALAYNGMILNQHYVPALCTPSRASFLTGKYPTNLGMQKLVLLAPEPWGLPLEEKIMPQYLKEAGYATHAIGKWHLGFYKKEYTPLFRGFDSHFGYWNGYQDYYDHSMLATLEPWKGYDMRRNMSVDWDSKGRYSTDLFTEEAVQLIKRHPRHQPLFLYLAHLAPHAGNEGEDFQAPDEYIARFRHIQDPRRRVYAAMVTKLDESVGEVMAALSDSGMIDNSIVLFYSDNGGSTFGIHSNRGSNWPLKGMKETVWEGGVRGAAAIWSPLFNSSLQKVSHQLMHVSDWLPTFYTAAGLDSRSLPLMDGISQWETLTRGRLSARNSVLHQILDEEGIAGLRYGDWKYVQGASEDADADSWHGESGVNCSEYDPQLVLESPAAAAILAYQTQLQIKLNKNDKKSDPRPHSTPVLNESRVQFLRSSATVDCGPPPENIDQFTCESDKNPCLFNILEDPCERVNLANSRPELVEKLKEIVQAYRELSVAPLNKPADPRANPVFWNNTWSNWGDSQPTSDDTRDPEGGAVSSLIISAIATVCLLTIFGITCLVVSRIHFREETEEENKGNGNGKAQVATISCQQMEGYTNPAADKLTDLD